MNKYKQTQMINLHFRIIVPFESNRGKWVKFNRAKEYLVDEELKTKKSLFS